MSSQRPDILREICADIEISEGDDVVHRTLGTLAAPQRRAGQTHQTSLRTWLTELVYLKYHARSDSRAMDLVNGGSDARNIPDWEDRVLAEQLVAADGGRVRWETGWRVLDCDSGAIRVQSDGVSLLVREQDIRRDDPGTDACSVRMPILRRYPQAGWIATGGLSGHLDLGREILRIYLAVTEECVANVIGLVLRRLDSLELRYSLKAGNHAAMFERADAMVVYLDEAEAHEHWGEIWSLLLSVAPRLRAVTPGFAEQLLAGVGVGREPRHEGAGWTSLGQHRSHLVASGLLAAPHGPGASSTRLYEAVCAAFREAGVSHESPAWDRSRGRPPMLETTAR